VIHGGRTEHLPDVYMRYLSNFFIGKLKLKGTPLRIELKSGKNPYAGKNRVKKHKK
jgi:GTP-binding protein